MARTSATLHHEIVSAFEHNPSSFVALVARSNGGELQLVKTVGENATNPSMLAAEIQSAASNSVHPLMFLAKGLKAEGGWTVVTYTDDELHEAKDRMVLASVKESVREQLGASHFSQDLHASCLADLQPAELLAEPDTGAVLSAEEQVAADVQRQEASTTADGPTGGSKVPFQSTPALLKALQGFAEGAIMVTMNDSEQFDLHSALGDSSAAAVDAALPSSAPAFFLAKTNTATVFAFWCPDAAAARPRMMHSAAKGALLTTVSAAGVAVDRSCDVRDEDDVQEALSQQAAAAATAAGDDSAALQELQFDRPSAPQAAGGGSRRRKGGRGKPKIASVEL